MICLFKDLGEHLLSGEGRGEAERGGKRCASGGVGTQESTRGKCNGQEQLYETRKYNQLVQRV